MTMPDTRRVVVGVDGSAASLAALDVAATEAALRNVPLHIVYAYDVPRQMLVPDEFEQVVAEAAGRSGGIAPA